MTITGTNLANATAINFGTVAGAIVSDTATQIVVTDPADSAATVDVIVVTAGGTSATSAADHFTYVSLPVVTAVNPASGPLSGSTTVTITGANLANASTVDFGTVAATIVSDTGTQITAMDPAGTAGTVDVTVVTAGGTSATSTADQFTYVALPVVTAVSPANGPLSGSTSVTITGTNLANATAVNFGSVDATIVSNTATQIVVTTPAGSAGTVDVTVVTPGGTSASSTADHFSYVSLPVVIAVSPASGPLSGSITVTITGTNLSSASVVNFGAVAGMIVSDTATQIEVTNPAGVAGTVDVTVVTAGGTSATSTADHFTYVSLPVVTAVSPSTGPLGGSTSVTLTGANLANATAVNFGGVGGTIVSNTGTQIVVTNPAAIAGTVDVTVVTPGGTSATSTADHFTYVGLPVVTAVSPATGPLGGSSTVSITGTNLANATAVNFGTTAGTIVSDTGTQIVAMDPAGIAGTVDVTVITAGGTSSSSSADHFTYVSLPVVTAVSPSSGPLGGSSRVTITGANLANATAVNFGGVAGTIVSNTGTQIVATNPAAIVGTVDVTVVTLGGTSATSAADHFTYASVPIITAISPTSGPLGGSTTITINGANFDIATAVNFGGIAGTIISDTSTQIVATDPAGIPGTVDVTVTTLGGMSATSAADHFTYVSLPVVTSVNPASGFVAGGGAVTITGANLSNATAVSFGGIAGTIISDTATQIVVTSPARTIGLVDVTVGNAGGTSAISTADHFTYVALPVVTGVSPASGPLGGATEVIISGANLANATTVDFGGLAGTIVSDSATQIVATNPANSAETVDVTITTAVGISETTSADQFTYVATPVVTGVSNGGNSTVIITGTNLGNVIAVDFSGIPGTIVSNTGTQIVAIPPAGLTGTVDITVVTAGGTSAKSSADRYTTGTTSTPTLVAQPLLIGGNPNGTADVDTESNGTYTLQETPQPFGNIPTDVRTAVGDVNGDGTPDYIFATGPGTEFMITVISGAAGNAVLVPPFDPFPPPAGVAPFNAGGFVSAGSFLQNGRAQIVVTPDQAGGPRVTIYDLNPANISQNAATGGLTALDNYFVNINPNFRGGLRTAVGDLNGDGIPDLVVAAGFGGGPVVEVMNGTRALVTTGQPDSDYLIGNFFAFASTLRDGAYLAVGDVLGNGQQDLILGPGAGGPAEVEVLSGAQLVNAGAVSTLANPVALFTPTGLGPSGSGVRVAVAPTGTGDQVNVVVGAGRNMPGVAKVYPGTGFTSGSTSEPSGGQFLSPFGGGALTDGIFVG